MMLVTSRILLATAALSAPNAVAEVDAGGQTTLVLQMLSSSSMAKDAPDSGTESELPDEGGLREINMEAIVCFVALILLVGLSQYRCLLGRHVSQLDKMGYVVEHQKGFSQPAAPNQGFAAEANFKTNATVSALKFEGRTRNGGRTPAEQTAASAFAQQKRSNTLRALGLEFSTATYKTFITDSARAGDAASSEFWRKRMLAAGHNIHQSRKAATKSKQGPVKDSKKVGFAEEVVHGKADPPVRCADRSWNAAMPPSDASRSMLPSQLIPPPTTPPPPAPCECQCADVKALTLAPPPGLTLEPSPGLSTGRVSVVDFEPPIGLPPGLCLEAVPAPNMDAPIGPPPGLSLSALSVTDRIQIGELCDSLGPMCVDNGGSLAADCWRADALPFITLPAPAGLSEAHEEDMQKHVDFAVKDGSDASTVYGYSSDSGDDAPVHIAWPVIAVAAAAN